MKSIATYSAYLENALQQAHFPTEPANLYDPLGYFLQLGGKRMRPMLSLMACKMTGSAFEKALPAALAVEYFHNFSLIHDDIMDAAPIRRGQATVHEKWNGNIAILSGDVLLVKAYEQLAKYDSSTFHALFNVFNKTAIEVCEGQQMDMDFETMDDVTIDQYMEMITLKTAVLLAASLKTGGMIAGSDVESCRHLYEFGKNIGVAFQLQDDILDVFGDMAKVGKVQGGDIIANKKTFLWIKAFELANHDELEELHFWAGNLNADASQKVETVTAIYNRIGIRDMAEAEMSRYFDSAMLNLEAVDAPSERKSVLTSFAEKLMVREK
mgnify:CR=1 FL=1